MIDVAGLVLFRNCVGISTSSPVAEVKRIANESPYTIVVATSLLRGAIARTVTKVFEVIVCLRLLEAWATPIIYRTGIATAPERLRHLQRDCYYRVRRRQSLGVSPVSFLNAAVNAVWEA
jgi:hypothetical protein